MTLKSCTNHSHKEFRQLDLPHLKYKSLESIDVRVGDVVAVQLQNVLQYCNQLSSGEDGRRARISLTV